MKNNFNTSFWSKRSIELSLSIARKMPSLLFSDGKYFAVFYASLCARAMSFYVVYCAMLCSNALHCTALHCTARHYNPPHYSTPQYTSLLHNPLHYSSLHCSARPYSKSSYAHVCGIIQQSIYCFVLHWPLVNLIINFTQFRVHMRTTTLSFLSLILLLSFWFISFFSFSFFSNFFLSFFFIIITARCNSVPLFL